MSKVITFSRTFPSYHPRKGQLTFFVEKILNGIMPKQKNGLVYPDTLPAHVQNIINDFQMLCHPDEIKHHTIRAGKRWNVGDWFSPRVWSGKPYNSKQIIIAPDIQIKKIWDFEIYDKELLFDGKILDSLTNIDCAINDGLEYRDFLDWFQYPKPFSGQIICWNDKIEY